MRTQRSHTIDPADRGPADRPSPEAAGSRRALLGATAGVFALATSGLLLPEWLVAEVAAADHPVRGIQQRADKRRDRKHHRLKQKRTKQRRQGAAGSGDGPGVGQQVLRLALVNASDLNTLAKLWTGTNGWSEASGAGLDIDPNTTLGPYDTADRHAGIEFFNFSLRPFFWVEIPNGAATTTLQSGGIVGTDGYHGGTTIVDHLALGQGDAVTKVINFGTQTGGPQSYRVTVSRENDTRDAVIFTILIANP